MSPKMDYDEWTPLGRGDPLKNDPTFDYSPPMVSKVKYWINPLYRTPDPPIVPNRETTVALAATTTEITAHYTATTVPSSQHHLIKPSVSSDIKRFYIDFKDPVDMTYVQMVNSKYNNKLPRPQQASPSYQSNANTNSNNYHAPTRQPPPPLPMLVPPPPVEPSSYSAIKTDNSTALELSWDIKSQQPPPLQHHQQQHHLQLASSQRPQHHSTIELLHHRTSVKLTPTTSRITMTDFTETTSEKSPLRDLLGKEKLLPAVSTTTLTTPLTPNPVPYYVKLHTRPIKPSSHLIIQGHSKVKKYGGTNNNNNNNQNKLDRSDLQLQDTNEINDVKFELPKDVRERKQLNVEDFLPFNGFFKDFIANQAEGSGFGAELTRAIFPNYVRPLTTLQYDSPRSFAYSEDYIVPAVDEPY